MRTLLLMFVMVAVVRATLMAGAAKINATLPLGTPLAGYNHGDRRVKEWPIPKFGPYTTWMTGATGHIEPTWVKALVIDNGDKRIAFATLDGIGSDGTLNRLAFDIAKGMGLTVPWDNIIIGASHSHSGPGGVSPDFLWSVAPATDLLVPELQRSLATSIATALVEAEKRLVPSQMDVGTGMLTGVTVNRRAKESPRLNRDSIDPHLGVIRVDDAKGNRIATLWNFAIHGVCYGPDNMKFSGDIMGVTCEKIEESEGGVALFLNADAGDIDPAPGVCDHKPAFAGAPVIASAVHKVAASLNPSAAVAIKAYSHVVDFGPTDLNATLGRFDNCTHGGPMDICTICEVLRCDANVHMPAAWMSHAPKFSSISFVIGGKKSVVTTMPGEPLLDLGWWHRNDTHDMGYDVTLLAGYSNDHMGYFCTPFEYDLGGYESQLTLWGIKTAEMIRDGAKAAAEQVVPN